MPCARPSASTRTRSRPSSRVEPGKILYRGKVVDVERRATEGFLRGRTRFDGMDEYKGAALELNFQNEWIVAWLDGKPIAMSPDLICVLDSVSGEAVGTETIRYGQRVTVIALPPPPVFLLREGPAACRPARLRLRHRLQERVRVSLRDLSLDDIESLAVGAWVLGTGGGGNPYLPLLNMRALYRDGHRVQLMDAADLADDDWVGTVANMGAPLVGQERLTDSLTLARAVSVMEKHIGRRFAALMSMEIGGANGVRPFMAAAHLKRPVVDSDTMGRAYPEAQMTSVAVGGLTPYPLTAVDVRGFESIVHKVPTWKWTERVARKICVEYGSVAATCQPPRTGAEVKQWGIHGTTTKAIAIGQAVREAQRKHDDPIAAILSVEPGKLLYKGKVLDVARRATEGFLRGVAALRRPRRLARLGHDHQLPERVDRGLARRRAARHDARPDLRARLGVGRGGRQRDRPLRPAGHGDRPATAAVFLSPRGLDHVGPRAFGYDIDFRSVFDA